MRKLIDVVLGDTNSQKLVFGLLLLFSIITNLFLANKESTVWYDYAVLVVFYIICRFAFVCNDLVYFKISGGKGINLRQLTTDSELDNRINELKSIDSTPYGIFRVMTTEERILYSFSILFIISGFVVVISKVAFKNYEDLADWFSITAFGLTIYPLLQAQVKERLSKKIAELDSRISNLQLIQERNKIDKILSNTERILNKVN